MQNYRSMHSITIEQQEVKIQKQTCARRFCKVIAMASLWAGVNYAFQGINYYIPPEQKIASNAITAVQIALNVVITSPIFIPFQSWLNQKAYGLGTKKTKVPFSRELEELWWLRQEILTVNQQISIDRLTDMNSNMKIWFHLAASLCHGLEEEQQKKKLIELLVLRIYEQEYLFPDFKKQEILFYDSFRRYYQLTFSNPIFNNQSFKERLKESLKSYDPEQISDFDCDRLMSQLF